MLDIFFNKLILKPENILLWRLKKAGFQSFYRNIDGCRMHYIQKNGLPDRPVLAFVHGFSANAVHWNEVLLNLSRQGFGVVSIDMPGHGFSTEFYGSLSFDHLFQCTSDLLKTICPERFVIVGNSLGGAIALRFALENADRLIATIVISPAGKFETNADWKAFRASLEIKENRQAIDFLKKIYHKPPWYMPVLAPSVIRSIGRKGIGEFLESVDVDAAQEPLKNLKVPTLFIWGENDKLLPKQHLLWYKENLPDFVLIEEPKNIGHCPQLDNPKWLSRRLVSYLQKTKSARAN